MTPQISKATPTRNLLKLFSNTILDLIHHSTLTNVTFSCAFYCYVKRVYDITQCGAFHFGSREGEGGEAEGRGIKITQI